MLLINKFKVLVDLLREKKDLEGTVLVGVGIDTVEKGTDPIEVGTDPIELGAEPERAEIDPGIGAPVEEIETRGIGIGIEMILGKGKDRKVNKWGTEGPENDVRLGKNKMLQNRIQ